ncbi:MAG TPA: hypothetical protein VN646_16885 [Candidatus Acidoferrum sp.]|nr:hypothetical protein [Candidatus Acidoferrum sp.]
MSAKKLLIGGAAVVGAIVLWRLLRDPLSQFAGGLVTQIGGKTVADAAQRAALGEKGYANVVAMKDAVRP